LERVVGALSPQVTGGELPQLLVDQWRERLQGATVAGGPLVEEL
jgi:hypothetical protein